MNLLEEPLRELYRHLNVVYGFLVHLEYQLENYVAAMRAKFGEAGPEASDVAVYASVLVEDLTHPSGLFRFPSGVFSSEGEEYLQGAQRLINRNSGWAVAQGWERFESFLFDVAAAFLVASPGEVEAKAKAKFLMSNPSASLRTLRDMRSFLKRMYEPKDLLRYLRKLAPPISLGEKDNNRKIDLKLWYRTAAKVRHAITHSDEVIPLKDFQQVTSSGNDIIAEFFPGTLESAGYRLCISKPAAQEVLVVFASYGFLIFKGLSMRSGYDWDVLKGNFAKQNWWELRQPNQLLKRTPEGAA